MTVVVPFDNSELSRAALRRARELVGSDEQIRVVSVIPSNNKRYARERGWIGETEDFDGERIVQQLRETVADIAPDAAFEFATVGRYANSGQIANKLRNFARNSDARVVVLGSENAGRIVSAVTSVGSTIASSSAYDVYIVRQAGGER